MKLLHADRGPPVKPSKATLVNIAMASALIGLAVAGHRLSPLLLPKADVTAAVEGGCDLQKSSCTATLPRGGRLELSISPRPIPVAHPFRVEVAVNGIDPRKVELDFAGETMNMGYNRSELSRAGSGRYAGEVSLPVCVSGGMAWLATVIVETDGQRIAAPFRFETGH